MEPYQFDAWVIFGKGDTGETEVWVDLTDDEIERLEEIRKTPCEDREEFSEDSSVGDIYKKVYEAAVEQITEELLETADPDEYDEEWRADETFQINVDVPWAGEEYEEDE